MENNYKTLGDIPKVKRNLRIWDKRFIRALHFFIFHNLGGRDRRARIRDFSGFNFKTNDRNFKDKVKVVSDRLSTSDLVSICAILEISTDPQDLIKHIFNHLIAGTLLKYNAQDDSNDAGGSDVNEGKENASGVNKESGKQQRYGDNVGDLKPTQIVCDPILEEMTNVIQPFRGCNDYPIECWVKDFEYAASALQLKEWQKSMLAKRSIKGVAKSLIEEKGIYKWDELKAVLMKEFTTKMSGKKLHETLKARTKKKNESVVEYYKQMKIIASQGSIGDLDLMDYVIEGTPNDPWKAVLYGATSLNHFRQKLKDYDFLAKKREKTISDPESPNHKNEEGEEGVSRPTSKQEQDTRRCLTCRTPIDCRENPAELKCGKCQLYSHMSTNCESEMEDLKYMRENFNGLPKKEVFLRGKRLYAMIDSGSQLNLINCSSYYYIGSPNMKSTVLFLRGFGKAKVPPVGYFEEVVQIDGYSFNTRFYVVSDDVLKRDVIIGSTLLQQAEFTFRRNEILIRKVENPDESNMNSSIKNVKRPSSNCQCMCPGRKMEQTVVHKQEDIAKECIRRVVKQNRNVQKVTTAQQTYPNDLQNVVKLEKVATAQQTYGNDLKKSVKLPKVTTAQQTHPNDLQNSVKNEKDMGSEYQQKLRSADEYFPHSGTVINNQVSRIPTDTAETCKISESETKAKKGAVSKVILVESDKNENYCKLIQEEPESMEELKEKCSILEKNLIDLTKDFSRLRKENRTVVNLLSEEKLKRKKLMDKFRDCRPLKKGSD